MWRWLRTRLGIFPLLQEVESLRQEVRWIQVALYGGRSKDYTDGEGVIRSRGDVLGELATIRMMVGDLEKLRLMVADLRDHLEMDPMADLEQVKDDLRPPRGDPMIGGI